MSSIGFLINRWLAPAILAAIYLIANYNAPFRKLLARIPAYLERKTGEKVFPTDVKFWSGLRSRFDGKCVFISIIIALATITIFELIFGNLRTYGEPVWFASITGGLVNPIAEEVLIRGLFLNLFVYLALVYRIKSISKKVLLLAGLVITSTFFALSHPNIALLGFTTRFAGSMIYGGLYLAGGRNLLPPIVAHATWNWYLVIKDALILH